MTNSFLQTKHFYRVEVRTFDDSVILFSHVLPIGIFRSDLERFVSSLVSIYDDKKVFCYPVFPSNCFK